MDSKISLAIQSCANMRSDKEISYITLTKLFKNEIPYEPQKYQTYLVDLFEEAFPTLLKKFMVEHNISRNEVLSLFNQLPNYLGQTFKFRKAIEDGKF